MTFCQIWSHWILLSLTSCKDYFLNLKRERKDTELNMSKKKTDILHSRMFKWRLFLIQSGVCSPNNNRPIWSHCKIIHRHVFYEVGIPCQEKRRAVWPDWPLYWTLGNFLKPLAAINLTKIWHILRQFLKVSKYIIFLVKSFLGNFCRHLAIFFWSHWWRAMIVDPTFWWS